MERREKTSAFTLVQLGTYLIIIISIIIITVYYHDYFGTVIL